MVCPNQAPAGKCNVKQEVNPSHYMEVYKFQLIVISF